MSPGDIWRYRSGFIIIIIVSMGWNLCISVDVKSCNQSIEMGVGFFVVNRGGDPVFGYGKLDVEERKTAFCYDVDELQG